MKWPPRPPDLTPCDSFLWDLVKEKMLVPSMPLDIDNVKLVITAAIETIKRNILQRVRDEPNYKLDVCRVKTGAHNEHL
jgi:hypothetical protein